MPRNVKLSTNDNLDVNQIYIEQIEQKRKNMPSLSDQKHSAAMKMFHHEFEKIDFHSTYKKKRPNE